MGPLRLRPAGLHGMGAGSVTVPGRAAAWIQAVVCAGMVLLCGLLAGIGVGLIVVEGDWIGWPCILAGLWGGAAFGALAAWFLSGGDS